MANMIADFVAPLSQLEILGVCVIVAVVLVGILIGGFRLLDNYYNP